MERNRPLVLVALVAACLVSVGNLDAGYPEPGQPELKKYELKYKFNAGDVFDIVSHRETTNTSEAMGNRMVTQTEDHAEYDLTTLSGDSQGGRLEATYTKMVRTVDGEKNPGGLDFSELLGRSARFKLSTSGELTDFEGLDKLPETMIRDASSLSRDQYLNMIRTLFVRLPKEPVVLGESWFYRGGYSELVAGGELDVVVDYKYTVLNEVEKDGIKCLALVGNHALKLAGETSAQGLTFVLALSGDATDTVYFDMERGMILAMDHKSVVEGQAQNQYLGVTMPMQFESKLDIDVAFRETKTLDDPTSKSPAQE